MRGAEVETTWWSRHCMAVQGPVGSRRIGQIVARPMDFRAILGQGSPESVDEEERRAPRDAGRCVLLPAVPCRTCTWSVPYLVLTVPYRTCTVPYLFRTVPLPYLYRTVPVPYLYRTVPVPYLYRACTAPVPYRACTVPYHYRLVPALAVAYLQQNAARPRKRTRTAATASCHSELRSL